MPSFKCLYYFTSTEISVIEIKRTDLPEGSPLSDIYKWLVIFLSSENLFELRFKSMGKTEQEEFREFSEGEFKFSLKEGHLNFQDYHYVLERRDHQEVPNEMLERIGFYLKKSVGYKFS